MSIIIGKNNIKRYINGLFNKLVFSKAEIKELLDLIEGKYNYRLDEILLLKEIISFLDNRPLFTRNLLNIPLGVYRTMEGNADEMIVVGKLIKMGFNCSRVNVTNSKYDAVIDKGTGNLLRIQIKGTTSDTLDLTCGGRSGQQISRTVPSRKRKLTSADCDLLIGVCNESGICYVIPANHLSGFGNTTTLSALKTYKEKWSNI